MSAFVMKLPRKEELLQASSAFAFTSLDLVRGGSNFHLPQGILDGVNLKLKTLRASSCKLAASTGVAQPLTTLVNGRRARLAFGWVTVFGRDKPSEYVTSHLGRPSLPSLGGQ